MESKKEKVRVREEEKVEEIGLTDIREDRIVYSLGRQRMRVDTEDSIRFDSTDTL